MTHPSLPKSSSLGLPRPDISARAFTVRQFHTVIPKDGTPLASFNRRLLAMLVDISIVILIWLPLALLLGLLMSNGSLGPIPKGDIVLATNAGPGRWVFLPLALIYFVMGTWLGDGQTLGKRFLHIRVVSLENPEITLWTSAERTLGYFASMLEFGFGFLQYFLHHNRQTVHDRIAETVVIYQAHRRGAKDSGE